MTAAYVQLAGAALMGTAAATQAVPVTANTTAGHMLSAAVRMSGAKSLSSVTDSQGNTWQVDANSAGAQTNAALASCILATALTTADTITMHFSGSCIGASAVTEYSGIATTGSPAMPVVDQHAILVVSGLAGTVATTANAAQAGDMVVTSFGTSDVLVALTVTAADPDSGGTWTQPSLGGVLAVATAYQPGAGTTEFAATWTSAAGTTNCSLCIAAYTPASSVTTWPAVGTAAGSSAASGALVSSPAAVTGTASKTSSASAAFTPQTLAGTAAASSPASGALTPQTLAGTASKISATTAAFIPAVLAGTAAGTSSAAGVTVAADVLTATATGTYSATGSLVTSTGAAAGTAAGTSSAAGAVTLGLPPQFTNLRIDGGGNINVFDISPATGAIVSGSDVQGLYLSGDKGLHWAVANTGVGAISVNISAVLWSVTEANTCYAFTGDAGSGGGMAASTDGGHTWTLRASKPQFAGNHRAAPLPNLGYARSKGRLAAQDTSYLFAATYNQGVLRSATAGLDNFPTTCTMAGATPTTGEYFCTALEQDPATAATLYVSMYDYDGTGTYGHVWKTTTGHSTTPDFTKLTASPAIVEDLRMVGTYLYAAAGSAGIFRSTDGGTTWQNLNGTGIGTSGNYWTSVEGYVDGSGNHIIYAADSNAQAAAACIVSLLIPPTWPGSGSITYANQTGSVQSATVPPDGRSWWHAAAGDYQDWIGTTGWFNPMLVVDASNLAAVNWYATGNDGFATNLAGAGWTISCNGQAAFVGRSVAADPSPSRPGHMVFGDTDWGAFDVTDGIAYDASTTAHDAPVNSQEGFACAFDPVDSTVYMSSGTKGANSSGTLWSRPWNTPGSMASPTWTQLTGFASGAGGNVATGLCGLRDGSNVKTVIAATWAGGIWRGQYVSSWTWTKVSSAFMTSGTDTGQATILANVPGSPYVYCFDRSSGVWRSADYGVTWVPVWSTSDGSVSAGAIAADPNTPGLIWVTTDSGLYKITGAHTGTVGSGATLSGPLSGIPGSGSPGAVGVLANSSLVLVTQDTGSGSGIWVSVNGGTSWTDGTGGDGSFAAANCLPRAMAIASDGRVYVTGVNIVTQGYPLGTAALDVLTASAAGTSSASGTLTITTAPAATAAGSTAASGAFAPETAAGGAARISAASGAFTPATVVGTAASLSQAWGSVWLPLNLVNDGSGGVLGQTVTHANSGGASGNWWDTVNIGSLAAFIYDNTFTLHGEPLVYMVSTGASASSIVAEWTTTEGTLTTAYWRVYVIVNATVTPAWRPVVLRSGASHAGSLLLTGNAIQTSFGAAFIGLGTFVTTMPIGSWVRFEGYVTGDAAAGVVSTSVFLNPESYVPDETHTYTGLNTVGALTQYCWGQGNSVASSGPFWFTGAGVSAIGPLGPIGPGVWPVGASRRDGGSATGRGRGGHQRHVRGAGFPGDRWQRGRDIGYRGLAGIHRRSERRGGRDQPGGRVLHTRPDGWDGCGTGRGVRHGDTGHSRGRDRVQSQFRERRVHPRSPGRHGGPDQRRGWHPLPARAGRDRLAGQLRRRRPGPGPAGRGGCRYFRRVW